MQQTQNLPLLSAVVANGSSAAQPIRSQDSFAFWVYATGGTVAATVTLEAQNPDGSNNWHKLVSVVLSAAGAAPVANIAGVPVGCAIRATVSGWTSGAITASVTVGSYSH
jgi:hypothetical protein